MTMDTLVTRLARLDTCAVSDALDGLALEGVAGGIHPMTSTARIAGRAVTVKLGPAGATSQTPARHLGTAAIEAASAGDVIVVDHQGREDAAGWGGILSTAAKHKGLSGVVVDGACRDVDEARALSFPIFATSATPRTARGRAVEESYNVPVSIRGIAIRPGDLVLADGSDVVVIPAEQAEQVLATAEEIAAREAAMIHDVLAGRPVSEVMGPAYEVMTARAVIREPRAASREP
jgi:4-hydroxy-4-methyl-2-oxoglutarate aldolase